MNILENGMFIGGGILKNKMFYIIDIALQVVSSRTLWVVVQAKYEFGWRFLCIVFVMRSLRFIYLKSWRMYCQFSFNRLRKLQIKYQVNMNTLMIGVNL
jgi:hypothetical protein